MSAVELPGVTQVPGHTVAGVQGPQGVGIACSCGQWQAYVRGVSSARWAGQGYRDHLQRVGAG